MKFDEIQKKLINTKVDSIVDNILVNGDSETKNSLIKMLIEKIKSTETSFDDVRMKALKHTVNKNSNNQQNVSHDQNKSNDKNVEKLESISNDDVNNILKLNLTANNVISKHNLIESYRNTDILNTINKFDVNAEMKEANKLLSKSEYTNTSLNSNNSSISNTATNDLINSAQN